MQCFGAYTNYTQDILQRICPRRFCSSTLHCLTLIHIALIQRPNLKNEAEWLACFEQVSCTCLAYRWIINRRFGRPFLEECLMQERTNSSWIYVAGTMASAVQKSLKSKHIIRTKILSDSTKKLAILTGIFTSWIVKGTEFKHQIRLTL